MHNAAAMKVRHRFEEVVELVGVTGGMVWWWRVIVVVLVAGGGRIVACVGMRQMRMLV